jgi:hypothetical protein
MSSKRTYTRRSTRDRVVALLEEAISLVKARCMEPVKGSPEDILSRSRGDLEESKRKLQEAMEIKREANAVFEASRRQTPYPIEEEGVSSLESTESTDSTDSLETVKPRPFVPITRMAPVAPFVPSANSSVVPPSKKRVTMKKSKLPSDPGLRADKGPDKPGGFNDFLKEKREEVEAQLTTELGQKPSYDQVRGRISELWKRQKEAQGVKVRTSRKLSKMPQAPQAPQVPQATPGRVNAIVPLPQTNIAELSRINEGQESPEVQEYQESPEVQEVPEGVPEGVTDLGMNDMLGMRRIEVNNEPYFMTTNQGLFRRDSDEEAGSFVGYYRNGKIDYQDEP